MKAPSDEGPARLNNAALYAVAKANPYAAAALARSGRRGRRVAGDRAIQARQTATRMGRRWQTQSVRQGVRNQIKTVLPQLAALLRSGSAARGRELMRGNSRWDTSDDMFVYTDWDRWLRFTDPYDTTPTFTVTFTPHPTAHVASRIFIGGSRGMRLTLHAPYIRGSLNPEDLQYEIMIRALWKKLLGLG